MTTKTPALKITGPGSTAVKAIWQLTTPPTTETRSMDERADAIARIAYLFRTSSASHHLSRRLPLWSRMVERFWAVAEGYHTDLLHDLVQMRRDQEVNWTPGLQTAGVSKYLGNYLWLPSSHGSHLLKLPPIRKCNSGDRRGVEMLLRMESKTFKLFILRHDGYGQGVIQEFSPLDIERWATIRSEDEGLPMNAWELSADSCSAKWARNGAREKFEKG